MKFSLAGALVLACLFYALPSQSSPPVADGQDDPLNAVPVETRFKPPLRTPRHMHRWPEHTTVDFELTVSEYGNVLDVALDTRQLDARSVEALVDQLSGWRFIVPRDEQGKRWGQVVRGRLHIRPQGQRASISDEPMVRVGFREPTNFGRLCRDVLRSRSPKSRPRWLRSTCCSWSS
jgi:hypothetical protein